MKRLVMMVLLLFAASFAWAQPYKVGVHSFHTVTYSDGAWTFQTATKLAKVKGFNALVCCDHIEKIAKKSSFKNYLMDCEKNYGITIIPGVEVTVENCHTIVFGNLTVEALEKLNGAKTVKEVIALAIKYSLLTVAAHPFNKKYLYPFDLANGISGQEWFNDEGGKYEKNLELLKQAITSAWPIFNSAGIDSHAIADLQDRVRWQRLTWVFANSSSREDLLIAFKNGQTIASCSNYQLEGLNIIPGFDDKAIEPRFQFKVKSSDLVTAVRRVRIYRDNIVIMTRQIKPDSASKAFDFFDKDCPEGLHTYVIEVEKMLITSSIRIDVRKETTSAEIPEDNTSYNDWSPQVVGSRDALGDFTNGKGKALVFLSNRDGEEALYKANLNTDSLTRIVSIQNMYGQYSISPNEDIIFIDRDNYIWLLLFNNMDNVYRKIQKMDLKVQPNFFPGWYGDRSFFCQLPNGSLALIEFELTDIKPSWENNSGFAGKLGRAYIDESKLKLACHEIPNPKGEFISAKINSGKWRICAMNTSSEVKRWLTDATYNASEVAFGSGTISFAGTFGQIAFTGDKDGNQNIYRFDLVNNQYKVIKLTKDSAEDSQPCWAFNCGKIYFVSNRSGSKRIWEMKSDGSEQKMLDLK